LTRDRRGCPRAGDVAANERPLPPDTEARLTDFTELVATAIANAESRAGLARLAEEQAALRRVATLVAEGALPAAVFDAVAAEMATLLDADGITLVRYEPADEVTVLTEEPPPPGTEDRLTKFTRLLDTAIANADSRDQLTVSRARLVTEAHEARRRVVRDLHDGAQQGLVHTIIALKLAHHAHDQGQQDPAPLVSEALKYAESANDELRELVHGILPSVLTREGLRAGVDELAARMSIPPEIDIGVDRLPPVVEATAYFGWSGSATGSPRLTGGSASRALPRAERSWPRHCRSTPNSRPEGHLAEAVADVAPEMDDT
jgi:signal transduction histidine kinase